MDNALIYVAPLPCFPDYYVAMLYATRPDGERGRLLYCSARCTDPDAAILDASAWFLQHAEEAEHV
jgi:hypothetical protein